MSTEIALDDLFDEFVTQNPEVVDELVVLARRWVQRGFRRISIAMLFEVCRWERVLSGVGDDRWKLNNSYRSRMARKLMAENPDLNGLFILRELKT